MDANRLRAAIGAAVSVGRTSAGVSETKCFASVAAAGGEASRSLPRSPTARAVAELHAAARLCGSGAGGGGAAEGASGTGTQGGLARAVLDQHLAELKPRQLALVAWSLARLRARDLLVSTDLSTGNSLPQTLRARASDLDAQGVSMVLWALATARSEERMRTWPGPWGWKRRGGCRRARHKGSRTAFGLARPWPCTTFR
mmetsp:Transcript_89039/g.287939  ORF Transcript_89039/g.287939 Transcript_89039/m.287939 type:complete len:200 (-) Transcript_89039:1301-1900(-)